MKQYTNEQVTKALHAAVEERGTDYVYPNIERCVYVEDGAPSCLVGLAVHKLDPELFTQLIEEEADADMMLSAMDSNTLANALSYEALRALTAAQGAQDTGKAWGVAEEQFDTKFSNLLGQ